VEFKSGIGEIQRTVLYVNQKPYCFWDVDLKARNKSFVTSLDHKYFEFVAEQNFGLLDSDKKHYAAMSLRNSYRHALETFFALLYSSVQAPDYAVGWMQVYKNEDLRDLVKASRAKAGVHNKLGVKGMDFQTLAYAVLHLVSYAADKKSKTIQLFGELWGRLASDFLNEEDDAEYNSMKHGLRTSLGGFSIAVGLESFPGAVVDQKDMETLGGSAFGASFQERHKMFEDLKADNIKLRARSNNWDPVAIAQRILLTSVSIGNVISFLKELSGTSPTDVQFSRPQDEGEFFAPWETSVGVTTASADVDISVEPKHCMTREEMVDFHRTNFESPSES
jgi:hypothetical protein